MNISARLRDVLRPPLLTRQRLWCAYGTAVATDALQLLLGPFGWVFVDEGLDVLAMVIISAALGFHPLLLPTFVIELVPVADFLPTWTGCTAAVVVLRKRAQATPSVPPEPPGASAGPTPPKALLN
ncbi:MAG TPA: hypothetical protein VG167_03855 [Verrucomicrobiae bacterium]|nr:hypothetical protein [Verrucomicrobiae bacterium]